MFKNSIKTVKQGKKFHKKNVTRWNSILFMTRSVLKLTPAEYKAIRAVLPCKTIAQKQVKQNFDVSSEERDMLQEMVDILSAFEFVTDELQSNKVSISRVYPCIEFLLKKLNRDLDEAVYTKDLRKDLIESLTTRFGNLIKNEIFVVSTFLGRCLTK